MDESMIYQAAQLQQQSEEAEQQLRIIEEQIEELERFDTHLAFLEKHGTKGQEMMSAVGKGVYVKSTLEEQKLFVEIGAGVMIRKTPQETRLVIQDQLKKFKDARVQIMAHLQAFSEELHHMIQTLEAEGKGREHSHPTQ